MSIYYALVVRQQQTVLSEYTEYSGNFQQTVRELFKLIERDTKKSFQAQQYFFHCLDEDGITFICMAGEDIERKMAYRFLYDLKKTFFHSYTAEEINKARSYELEFAETI